MEKYTVKEIPRYPEILHKPKLALHDMKTVCHLCQQPYYNNPNGCRNFGTKPECPPYVLHISQQYDLSSINMLIMKFPFGEYIDGKKLYHPNWTLRELSNQRHWQLNIAADLRKFWRNVKSDYPQHHFIRNPEGQGVNVQETLLNHDIQLEWLEKDENDNFISYPEHMYHVYLMGKEIEVDE